MATFISTLAPGYYPRPGDMVIGKTNRKYQEEVEGIVLPAKKNPRKPAIFSRYGCVLLYIRTESGKQMCVNEVRPSPKGEEERTAFEQGGISHVRLF